MIQKKLVLVCLLVLISSEWIYTPIDVHTIERILVNSTDNGLCKSARRFGEQAGEVTRAVPTANAETDTNVVGMGLLDN